MHSDIASQIRTIVSKKKKRYQKQGFNLDLSYVTEKIIAMGFPADNFEALYRNSIDDVSKFFELNHGGQYKIYNLCRERGFDASKFSGEISRYPFDDHNPPAFTVLTACITDIDEFLTRHPKNVVAINCKAGKGRTGVIVCCSLLYSNVCKDATTALIEYGRVRTHNGKGVTIPSQIRYIFYYDHCLKSNLTYKSTELWLKLVKFDVVPNINNGELLFAVYQIDSVTRLHLSKTYKISKHNRSIIFHEMLPFSLHDDLKFEFMQRSLLGGSNVLCHCWLNTFFVVHQPAIQKLESDIKTSDQTFKKKPVSSHNGHGNEFSSVPQSRENVYKVSLSKQEIDKANKDTSCRIFPANFEISFLFSDTPPDLKSKYRSESSISQIGNSTFFESLPDPSPDSMIPQFEAMWKSSSSQFYSLCE